MKKFITTHKLSIIIGLITLALLAINDYFSLVVLPHYLWMVFFVGLLLVGVVLEHYDNPKKILNVSLVVVLLLGITFFEHYVEQNPQSMDGFFELILR